MARVQAFSSVSVVDLTDVGTINLYCTSNQPLSVIYDPNGPSYTPNWASSGNSLIITPIISYNGVNVPLTVNDQPNSALTVTFSRKEGNGPASTLDSSTEIVTNGVLTVSANKLSSATQITYVCHVTYRVPNTSASLETETSITYTKVTHASNVKDISIKGETAFLYSSDRNTVFPSSIILDTYLSGNISITKWQYQTYTTDTGGNRTYYFTDYPTGNGYNQQNPLTNGTWVVKPNEANIWIDNKYAVIKVVTDDNNVYDTIQINKIYDGTAGDAVVGAVLTNDNFMVPVNAQGNVISNNVWDAGATTLTIYEGGEEATGWNVAVTRYNVKGTYYSVDTTVGQTLIPKQTFIPSALETDAQPPVPMDVGYVEFLCTKQGYANIVKRYTISKQYAGVDGHDGNDAVVYSVEPSTYIINWSRGANNVLTTPTPSTVTFYAYSKTGTANKVAYNGRFRVYIKTGADYATTPVYETRNGTESSCSFNIGNYLNGNTITSIKCCLSSSSTWDILDEQTIGITADGTNGADGDNGEDAIIMSLGNYNDVIPCTEAGLAATQKIITIPFYVYKGITQVVATASVGSLPNGVSAMVTNASENNNGTVTNGYVTLTVAQGARFCGNNDNPLEHLVGDITIAVIVDEGTSDEISTTHSYTWTKNIKATDGTNGQDGEDAVLLQIYSLDGGVLVNSQGTTTLNSLLTSGSTTVSQNVTYVWTKYGKNNNNEYGYYPIQNETSSSLTVTPAMVDDLAFFRLQATYNNHNYYAYYTVDDMTDPYTAYTFATIEQFKNSQGVGAIYTRVYQNGVEVDPIKTTVFSTEAPTALANSYYYHMNPQSHVCTLKKSVLSGGSYAWVNVTDSTELDKLTYHYSALDNEGNAVPSGHFVNNVNARCFCISASDIDGRMQFICEVSGNT